ncbi:hypothetical protein [Kocuria sp. U4B]|jgi:hypothetical protein
MKKMFACLALAALAGVTLIGLVTGLYERAVLVEATGAEGRVHLVELGGIASSLLLVFVGLGGALCTARGRR